MDAMNRMLAGRHTWTMKIYNIGPFLRETMPDVTRLPRHFKDNGYFTRSLGKIYHVGIDDPKRAWDKAAFSEYPKGGNHGTAMRTDRYRYVEWRDKKGDLVARALYDHQADPQENENVASLPANEPVMERLSAQLRAARASATSTQGTLPAKP